MGKWVVNDFFAESAFYRRFINEIWGKRKKKPFYHFEPRIRGMTKNNPAYLDVNRARNSKM